MECHGEGGGEFAATEEPGDEDGDDRLEAEQGGETANEADGDAASDGVGGVANLRQALLGAAELEGDGLADAAHVWGVRGRSGRGGR